MYGIIIALAIALAIIGVGRAVSEANNPRDRVQPPKGTETRRYREGKDRSLIFHTAICAGAPQIALGAEFAPSLALQNGDCYGGRDRHRCGRIGVDGSYK